MPKGRGRKWKSGLVEYLKKIARNQQGSHSAGARLDLRGAAKNQPPLDKEDDDVWTQAGR